jgi:3',5'-cyclic AMP phosphodiesterase CpdA
MYGVLVMPGEILSCTYFTETKKPNQMQKFSMIVSSDPQYPWYDNVLPPGLTSEEQIKLNAQRQISQQYQSMNILAEQRKNSGSEFLIQGVLINGDLTAFGHDWQYDMYMNLLGFLKLPYYPMLGNHDYANNVNDSENNNCATRKLFSDTIHIKNGAKIRS